MSDTRNEGARRLFSALAPREWSLRRKVALAVLIPIALAAIFGGLRVRNDLSEADSYSQSASQVTVLRPAVAYLNAVETAVVVARQKTVLDDPDRDAAIDKVVAAGKEYLDTVKSAELTAGQREQAQDLYDRSEALREPLGYASVNQSVAALTQLQAGVNSLVNTILEEQREPDLRLQDLSNVIDGRASLAFQQFAVAFNDGSGVKPIDIGSEIGVEAAAIDRIAASLGIEDKDVAALRAQNAKHFGTAREGGTDLGDSTAYAPYDRLSGVLLDGIDRSLADAADSAQKSALIDSLVILAALLAAIFLALLVSRLLLDPIRRVREGALEVAQEKLPEAVRRIRAGGTVGEIEPINVTTHEEMGQLARAVDDLHREAISLASGEAELRTQVSQMFQTLSRRSTSLVNQQLGLIETLEKDEEDPKRLESLFRLDHLASRMRRTADSLSVLADAPAAPSDPNGLSVSDVLHASIAGVQEYQRVDIDSTASERVAGNATTDVVHLITELIDNALAYSPPNTQVQVTTKRSPEGVVIKVSDAGLGMKDDNLLALNDELRSGGHITPDTARRMGLLVVARLAQRHGMFVELERNVNGGVTASVVLPTSILRHGGLAQARPAGTLKPVAPVESTPTPASAASSSALAAFAAAGAVTEESAAVAPAIVEPVETVETVDEPAVEQAVPAPAALVEPVAPPPASTGSSALPSLPVRQPAQHPAVQPSAPSARSVPAPAAGLAARLQSMREAREAASLGNPGTPATSLSPAASALAPAGPSASAAEPEAKAPQQSQDSIEAAINAVIRLPQRRPGTADVPGVITPLSEPLPAAPAPVPVPFERAPVVEQVAEPVAEVVAEVQPFEPEPFVEPEPEPVVAEVEPFVPEPVVESAPVVEPEPVSPIPAAATSFHILDPQAPMPELVDEESTIFASMKSNWFNSDGELGQPWTGNEIDAGWQAADQVAEAAPPQVSDAGLPVRRPGSRIVPGGVTPAAATLVRDPEAIRSRLAAHAAGVNRGRKVANGPDLDTDHTDHSHPEGS
jgi:signal transduction histidine kinase